jgi:hypothetical protein
MHFLNFSQKLKYEYPYNFGLYIATAYRRRGPKIWTFNAYILYGWHLVM